MNAIDQIIVDSVDLAREAAQETAGDFGVGEYLGARVEPGSRQATHFFECPHPGYHGWHWAVTMTRAARARYATVNEVVLLPNSPNVIMAAERAAELSDKEVRVVAARSQQAGLSAAVGLEPGHDADWNAAEMEAALQFVRSGGVAPAARDDAQGRFAAGDAVGFVDDEIVAWGAADCAVSRAGAGSVAEAWANRVPTLFMPYPYHKDQHQRVNARPLVDAGGAMMVDDAIEPEANARALGVALPHLMGREAREAMRGALEKLGKAGT